MTYVSYLFLIELEASLNTYINRISLWIQENKLFLSMSKTEYVICGSQKRLMREDSTSLSCNGSSSTESESFKYLGVVIDQQLSPNNHIEHVVNKVSRNLGVLRRLRISIPTPGWTPQKDDDFTHFWPLWCGLAWLWKSLLWCHREFTA